MEKYCRKCNILLVCNINTYSPQDKILDKICRDCDNRESKIREQKRKEKDPVFKEKLYLRQLIHQNTFKNNKWSKRSNIREILGLGNMEEWLTYLESKFKDGMTWDNYGDWQLDHIVELHTASTIEELYKLQHHTNIQPLWKKDNMKKSPSTRNTLRNTLTEQEYKEYYLKKNREYYHANPEYWKKR
tara:strand:+ start:173 stop:733 length:561 start_codon:yes stop_codon:yes gene_type:complete